MPLRGDAVDDAISRPHLRSHVCSVPETIFIPYCDPAVVKMTGYIRIAHPGTLHTKLHRRWDHRDKNCIRHRMPSDVGYSAAIIGVRAKLGQQQTSCPVDIRGTDDNWQHNVEQRKRRAAVRQRRYSAKKLKSPGRYAIPVATGCSSRRRGLQQHRDRVTDRASAGSSLETIVSANCAGQTHDTLR